MLVSLAIDGLPRSGWASWRRTVLLCLVVIEMIWRWKNTDPLSALANDQFNVVVD
ncbi:hypothetical protein [Pseudomonas glycinae]|uniref:hypothetical protein n=1 Tax=Pseudomonas glycinae TaxID=1785145 RepID=UPI00167D650E|nr:hypothetical protein [Pseudomonas glycinae]